MKKSKKQQHMGTVPERSDPRSGPMQETRNYPHTDIIETPSSYQIQLEVPGYTEKEIQVRLDNAEILVVAGKREPLLTEVSAQTMHIVHIVERSHQTNFLRRFDVNGLSVKENEIMSRLEYGVLNVTLPKSAKANSSRVRGTLNSA